MDNEKLYDFDSLEGIDRFHFKGSKTGDFHELDDYLKNVFIPSCSKMLKNVSTNTKDMDKLTPYESVQLNKLLKLELGAVELEHAMEYLAEQGIRIGGLSPEYVTDKNEKYDYKKTYRTINWPEALSSDEATILAIEYEKTKDPETKKKLINGCLRLIPWCIYKSRFASEDQVIQYEFISYGYDGLDHAVEHYNSSYGCTFSTYAVSCIRYCMMKKLWNESIIPNYIFWDYNRAKLVVERNYGKKYDGSDEMIDDILELMISMGTIRREDKEYMQRVIDIDILASRNDFDEDKIEPDADTSPDYVSLSINRKEKVLELMECLTEREQFILKKYFGFDDGKLYSYEEIGKMFNVTRERIRQIIAKSLRKLRRPSRIQRIKDYASDNFTISSIYPEEVKSPTRR